MILVFITLNKYVNNIKYLKSNYEYNTELIQQQLNLALVWDRIDIAKKYLLQEKIWESKFFNSLIYTAIRTNRVDFIKEFLNHGLALSKFLTYRRLLKLYNDVRKLN